MQLPAQHWIEAPATQALLAAFGDVPLRFVGGCVRDALMGRPVGDIDCATPATPQQTTALLEAAGIKAIPTGIAHGTVTAVVDGQPYEITTLRRDVACDGRHAEVTFTDDWREDAQRRDFTLNAVFCDTSGALYDYTGGIDDAKAARIVFIGDASARIREDALRILRFFRFTATHGSGEPDAAALTACAAHTALLAGLSGERIQHEMLKCLSAPNPYGALAAMQAAGVLEAVIGGAATLQPSTQHPHALLRLALLLGSEAAAKHVTQLWRLSNAQRELLLLLCTHPYESWPSSDGEMIDIARHLAPETYGLLLRRNAARLGVEDDVCEAMVARTAALAMPVFPVSGADLLELGIEEGKSIGEALRRLEVTWESSGYLLDKDALLKLLG